MNLILFDRKEFFVSAKVISFSKFQFLHTVFGVKFNKVIPKLPQLYDLNVEIGIVCQCDITKGWTGSNNSFSC